MKYAHRHPTLAADEKASAYISFVYTILLSALIMGAVMVSIAESVDRATLANGQVEVDEVAARVGVTIEALLDLVRHDPDSSYQRLVILSHNSVGYSIVGRGDRFTVTQTAVNGAFAEMIIYNELGITITGRVGSSAQNLLIEYQPVQRELRFSLPVSGS